MEQTICRSSQQDLDRSACLMLLWDMVLRTLKTTAVEQYRLTSETSEPCLDELYGHPDWVD